MLDNARRQSGDFQERKNIIPLLTKFITPQIPSNYFRRSNIFKILLQGLKRKYTLISASDGYGKSSSLADFANYIQQNKYAALWFTVTKNDNQEEYFWAQIFYLFENFITLTEKENNISSHFKQLADMREKYEHFEQHKLSIANELSALANQTSDIVLIIDNFELLTNEDVIKEFVEFTTLLSSRIHIYLSSRYTFNLSLFDALQPEVIYTNISEEDFSLTPQIAREIAEKQFNLNLEEDLYSLLLEKTGRWPFAVSLVFEQLTRDINPREYIEQLNSLIEPFNGYFLHNLFEQFPQAIQEFVINTSILDYLSPQLCNYILNSKDSDEHIAYLASINVLKPAQGKHQKFYCYRTFFGDWVKQQMSKLPAHFARRLNLLASQWYKGHEDKLIAAKFITHAVNRKDLTRLLEGSFPNQPKSTLELYQSQREISSIENAPLSFCVLAAWAYLLLVNISEAQFWIEQADSKASSETQSQTYILMQVIRAKNLGLKSDFKESLQIVDDLLQNQTTLNDTALHIMSLNCAAEAYSQNGETEKALELFQNIRTLCKHYSFTFIESINEYELAYLYCYAGQLNKAASICNYITKNFPVDYPAHSGALALLGYIALLQDNSEQAQQYLTRAQSYQSENNNIDMFIDTQITRALYETINDNKKEALHIIQELKSLVNMTHMSIPRGAAARIYLYEAFIELLKSTSKDEIINLSNSAIKITISPSQIQLTWKTLLIALQENNDIGEKINKLFNVIDEARASSYEILVLYIRLYVASIQFENKQYSKAYQLIQQALMQATSDQIFLPFVYLAKKNRNMFIKYIDQIHPEYSYLMFIRSVLQKESVLKQNDVEIPDAPIDPLTKREQEIIDLLHIGFGQQEIAKELQVSISTVKSHLSHIYAKFNVHKQKELLEKTQPKNKN